VNLWRRAPLWLRLITTVLALSAVALTVTGVFGARLLRGYLVDRVDDQLRQAATDVNSITEDLDPTSPQLVPSPYYVQVEDTRDQEWVVSRPADKVPPDFPDLTRSEAADLELEPFTVPAMRGGGSFRSVAAPVAIRFGAMAEPVPGTILIATSLDEVDATVHRLSAINLLVGGLVLGGLAIAGYSMVRTALRPLTRIEHTAAAIAGGELSRRVPDDDPGTEVGRLGLALNTMLEQIETAFRAQAASETTARTSEQKMRRFVADASHELRTPLTSIRGFAELHRQGAVTDPAEVSRLLGRIEDEAKRMGLLVDDLLLLARLDQQRPFQRTPVDLLAVAADAVEAARATAPDREIVLDTTVLAVGSGAAADRGDDDEGNGGGSGEGDGETAPLVVAGDEPRLRQVVANLLDNALSYSPAGTPITMAVGTAERDGHALACMEVRDRGAGLSAEQAERVFERFYRTDKARSRAHGGTGLGLSIVAAITAAHGGNVEVDTAPGEGATFRVLLPLAAAPTEPPDPPGSPEPSPSPHASAPG
jgi:two-component system OmpR family sensor kinase